MDDLPFILKNSYDFEFDKLNDHDNKIQCKGCETHLKFKIGDPSSNLVRHIASTNHIKHAKLYEEYNQYKANISPRGSKR